MHFRPRKKLAAQLKTVCRPVTMRVFYHTFVTKRPNYLFSTDYSSLWLSRKTLIRACLTGMDPS